jgi:hypothetical protein
MNGRLRTADLHAPYGMTKERGVLFVDCEMKWADVHALIIAL